MWSRYNYLLSFNVDCKGWYQRGYTISGVYSISDEDNTFLKVKQIIAFLYFFTDCIQVYCDMETDGGGWTVFQRRQDGSVDFYRNRTDYEDGFGNPKGEFWLGLSKIHHLTQEGSSSLRVEIGDFDGNSIYAQYSTFSVGNDSTEYRLNVSSYSGTAGDSLSYHSGSPFGTRDNIYDNKNCPVGWKGAWWFHVKEQCFHSHLNGLYMHQPTVSRSWHGIIWNSWRDGYTLKHSEMKLRRNY